MSSVAEVLVALVAEGRMPAEQVDRAAELLSGLEEPSPWYVKVLIGAGAWLATAMLLLFFFATKIVSSEQAAAGVGVFLTIGAVLLRWWVHSEFPRQMLLALSLTGQVLLVGGVYGMADGDVAVATAVVLELVLILAFPDVAHRFISVLLAVLALRLLIYVGHMSPAVHVLAVGLALVVTWLGLAYQSCRRGPLRPLCAPVLYGCVVALIGVLAPSALDRALFRVDLYPTPAISTVAFGLMLLGVVLVMLRRNGVAAGRSATVLGGLAAFVAAALQAPGVVLAVLLMLIGFERGDRVLQGLAVLALAVFLSAYYYALDLSLLTKSISLAAGGLVLLGLRWLNRIGEEGADA